MVRVAVLAGGPSSEHAVSLETGRQMLEHLTRGGHEARAVLIGHDDRWHLGRIGRDFDELDIDSGLGPDEAVETLHDRGEVAVLGLHGHFGEDGKVQQLLDGAGVPYTGSGAFASALCMDKDLTKLAAERLGARCAPHEIVSVDQPLQPLLRTPGVPCVVKPVCGGSSVATTIVTERSRLAEAVEAACRNDPSGRAMVEALAPGCEITATVLRHEGRVICLPLVAIEPVGNAFYDYHAKYESKATRFTCPAPVSESNAQHVDAVSRAIYIALELRGVVRLDFIAPKDDSRPVFLEVNTLPGFTSHSLVPMAAKQAGLSRLAVLEALLEDVEPPS